MTPADIARLVQRHGETVILRSLASLPAGVDVAVKARVTGFQPAELVGDIKQGDRRVVISHAEIAALPWPSSPAQAPKLGDRMIIGGKTVTIMAVDTRKIGDEIAGHWIVVRG
jgi:hypothetical protein